MMHVCVWDEFTLLLHVLLSPQTLCVRACAKQLHLFKASDLELENASLLTDYCEK